MWKHEIKKEIYPCSLIDATHMLLISKPCLISQIERGVSRRYFLTRSSSERRWVGLLSGSVPDEVLPIRPRIPHGFYEAARGIQSRNGFEPRTPTEFRHHHYSKVATQNTRPPGRRLLQVFRSVLISDPRLHERNEEKYQRTQGSNPRSSDR